MVSPRPAPAAAAGAISCRSAEVYDYLTNNQNDPLYPGGGANAYNDGAIIAGQFINSSNEAGFLATYNRDPAAGGGGFASLLQQQRTPERL